MPNKRDGTYHTMDIAIYIVLAADDAIAMLPTIFKPQVTGTKVK
jgi:hypothetical protein